MSKADKKQRHKARREAKRREWRRQQSVSPVRRLATAPGEVECWLSDTLENQGQAQVFVFKSGGGMTGIAAFLIDRGVVGLKDAWTRLNIDRGEFEEMIESGNTRGIPSRRATIDECRALVAGAMRWTHEHGMRLPKDWDRAAAFLGGVGEWMTADTSRFMKEFAGHPQDLRQRLVGQSFDSFTQRKDISFIFSSFAPYEGKPSGKFIDDDDEEDDDDDGEEQFDDEEDREIAKNRFQEFGGKIKALTVALAEETEAWLASRNETPAPDLQAGWSAVLLALQVATMKMHDGTDTQRAALANQFLEKQLNFLEAPRAEQVRAAVKQVEQHMSADSEKVQKVIRNMSAESGSGAGDHP